MFVASQFVPDNRELAGAVDQAGTAA
jgi:hypothetical protein